MQLYFLFQRKSDRRFEIGVKERKKKNAPKHGRVLLVYLSFGFDLPPWQKENIDLDTCVQRFPMEGLKHLVYTFSIFFYFFSPICFVTFPSYWRSLTRKIQERCLLSIRLCHEPRLEEGRFWPTDHSFLEVAGKGFSGFTKKNIFGLRFFSEPSICFFHTLLLCWPLPFVVDTDLFLFFVPALGRTYIRCM